MSLGLPLVFHPDYSAPLPSTHRFPMVKFRLLHEHLCRAGIARPTQFHAPRRPPIEPILRVHSRDYVERYTDGRLDAREQRRIGLPWSAALAHRTWIAVGGTLRTAELALERGLAINLAGGTHHAFPDYGSGFCIFNDVAIAARALLDRGAVERILILDLDVHQGDGTAWIFREEPRVFTCSMHCQSNFPRIKQASNRDVPLADGLADDDYLRALEALLPDLLAQTQPQLVFYNAGVDPHRGDRLGNLALSDSGLFRREQRVLDACLGAGIPVAAVIGGGYCEDFQELVFRHSLLFRAGRDAWKRHRL